MGCGRRMTVPRQTIMEVLSKTKDHLSAEDIYMKVHRICPSCGLTTVYRTLDLLVEMGMVAKLDFGDGRNRYELNEKHSQKDHHHHLICRSCHKVIDYTDFSDNEVEFLKKTETGLSKKYKFKIDDHIITFKGVCERCQ
jgi:Fur family ferric uptake transcriptional regulator